MAKAKTSRKRGFSLANMPITRLKKGVRLESHDTTAVLGDPHLVVQALMEALMDGDSEAFKEILAAHLQIASKESFFKKARISRRTLFRMLAPDGNPTLDNVARVVSAIARQGV